jgi:protein-disulfide isomerase
MGRATAIVLAVTAVAAVTTGRGGAAAPSGAAPSTAPAATASPAPGAADLPGVDLGALTPAQADTVRRVAAEEFCHCGCPHTLAGCLREHSSCKHAPRMAQLAVRLAGLGLGAGEIRQQLRDYYSAFHRGKRARLDVKDFGPPRGDPAAPVVLVEFSDFTCPFCQRLKPELDRWVDENAARVRLYYKPFPIASHPHAMEAAITAEWARDRGLFWKMYDQLFTHPGALSDDDLAGHAEAVGGDADDLRAALGAGRNRARIAASQAEARAARLAGTPTLYVNGRKLDLPLLPGLDEVLDLAVQDEEEWLKNGGGWARD